MRVKSLNLKRSQTTMASHNQLEQLTKQWISLQMRSSPMKTLFNYRWRDPPTSLTKLAASITTRRWLATQQNIIKSDRNSSNSYYSLVILAKSKRFQVRSSACTIPNFPPQQSRDKVLFHKTMNRSKMLLSDQQKSPATVAKRTGGKMVGKILEMKRSIRL